MMGNEFSYAPLKEKLLDYGAHDDEHKRGSKTENKRRPAYFHNKPSMLHGIEKA